MKQHTEKSYPSDVRVVVVKFGAASVEPETVPFDHIDMKATENSVEAEAGIKLHVIQLLSGVSSFQAIRYKNAERCQADERKRYQFLFSR